MNWKTVSAAAIVAAVVLVPVAFGQGGGLSAKSFGTISSKDLEKWESSGCSFAAMRGKDLVGIFDTQDKKKTALFKIEGKIVKVSATGKIPQGSYWFGNVAGNQLRMVKGPKNPRFKNDGGGEGGEGRIEWKGPAGEGSMPIRWEEGC